MKLKSPTFGDLEYDSKSLIQLMEGMLGFAQLKRYLLIENDELDPFKWLQSVEDPTVAFPVVSPHRVLPDYRCPLSNEDLSALQIERTADMVVLAVVVIPDDVSQSTVNLKAPVVINHRQMVGKQIILVDSDYDVRQPLIYHQGAPAGDPSRLADPQ
ncbi:MAG: flagellar assembly protein FliW [Acidobacteriota bacterium]